MSEYESNYGKWTTYHQGRGPEPYALTETYKLAQEFLAPCETVEDWGCGLGWFRQTDENPDRIRNVDGSEAPCVDVQADLETHLSVVDGIHCRHVLDHNPGWERILRNICRSATQRFVVTLFVPMNETYTTQEKAWVKGYEVPDLSLPADIVRSIIEGYGWEFEETEHVTGAGYGHETMFRARRHEGAL